jgi:nucleoside-diphosphate-sugar epimerase
MNEASITSGNSSNGVDNVLVTGAAGLLGSELVKQLLHAGKKVTAITHQTLLEITHPALIVRQCDILDIGNLEECMEGITHVYHCAGLVSFQPGDKRKLFKINVEGTSNVVNACLGNDVKKLIHVSSVSALGRIRQDVLVNETMQWSEETSNSIYGKTKYLAELEVWRGIGEGLKAVIVNPTIILGAGNWEDGSSAMFKSAYDEFKWYTEGVSGFVDVRDVALAMIRLMEISVFGERFIVNSENVSYKDLFMMIARNFGKRLPSRKVSYFMAALVWRMEALKGAITGKKQLVTKETARTSLAKVRFDNRKILNALPGFKFISIEKSVEDTCKKLKEKYQL